MIPLSVDTPASRARRKINSRTRDSSLEPRVRTSRSEFVIPPHFCNRRYRASGLYRRLPTCHLVSFGRRPGETGRRKLEPTATPHEHRPCGCRGDAADHSAAAQQLADSCGRRLYDSRIAFHLITEHRHRISSAADYQQQHDELGCSPGESLLCLRKKITLDL